MKEETWNYYLRKINNYSGMDTGGSISHIIEFLQKHYKKDLDLLDVGCANKCLKEHVISNYYGVDYPDDIHDLKYSDGIFDIVFCNHVLEHVLSPVIVINEIKRVLNEKGFIIIGVPCSPHFLSSEHIYILDRKGWEQLFKYCGLIIEDFEDKKYMVKQFK